MEGSPHTPEAVGILHPGEMGAALGAALVATGATVLWAADGRSEQTARRARDAGLTDVGTVGELVQRAGVVIAVCPPHAAFEVARSVRGYGGLYLDANAVSPNTAAAVAAVVEVEGATYVDGAIIGPPPTAPGTTRLYLSGSGGDRVAALFAASRVQAEVVSTEPTAASALKMVYAAWTKGSAALLLAIRAVARDLRIDEHLLAEWARSQPQLPERSEHAVAAAQAKGWRWVREMEEIADTFAASGMPPGFHLAAADVFAHESHADERAP